MSELRSIEPLGRDRTAANVLEDPRDTNQRARACPSSCMLDHRSFGSTRSPRSRMAQSALSAPELTVRGESHLLHVRAACRRDSRSTAGRTGDDFIQDRAEGPDVRPVIESFEGERLLGGHVPDGTGRAGVEDRCA